MDLNQKADKIIKKLLNLEFLRNFEYNNYIYEVLKNNQL